MTSLCPKPCSRLATAAVFMIIGVVQLLAGVILLRSKYADLLSGPDFMTGSSNIALGCIYGTISSIWKINNKKKSVKITARKNILAALLLSVITVNVTAAIILIMGEGNRLLNLHLENTKHKTIDFASEILAYAYISSVFSPIFCIVVSLVILSGRCIEICRDIGTEKAKNSIANDDCYNWVFDPLANGNVKVICDTVETSSESTSASEDSVFTEEDNSYSRRKSILSIKNIPSPLNMWEEKRERILNHANRSHKQPRLDLALEKSNFYDCCRERLIPRIKESSLRRDLNPKLGDLGKKPSKTFKSILKRSSSSPVARGAGFHAGNPTNNSVQTRCRYDCGQANDYENQENRFPEHLRSRKAAPSKRNKASKFTRSNGQSLKPADSADCEEIHFIDPVISELKAETLKELKQKVAKILPGASVAVIKLPDNSENEECVSEVPLRNTADLSEKPHCSDVSRYKLFTNCSESSASSGKQLLSDKTPDSVYQSSYSSENSPYVQSAYKNKGTKTGFSAISKIRSKSFDYLNEEEAFPNQDEGKFSSLMIVDEKKSFPLDSQKVSSSKQQSKKFDTSRKMSMASIAEIPSEEDYFSERNSVCSTSDFGDNSQRTDENSNIRVKMSPTSRHIPLSKASRRKSSLSSHKLLKRMWSSSEPKINVSDLIVDKDSLIGLSEEELVARTFRIRSLRKTVEDRLKKKKEAEKAKNTYSSAL
ncbi:hypothetical protein AVEN_180009-1 [Araneus ventricosus]|uniref:Uncharacterized protein n=1 Tax=Araneus ventricosus TaxID=182803 RepID=A0A4Y2P2N5_ARAVE|nr:hypothetical protein AVEN_175297-1 [Araneus ventricosus]GBN46192.1 hypothetical protein AVEN_180009-1 [Araneus ventricosus]